MKILVIAETINVEDSSAAKVNLALVRNLVKAGFELKVYHYSYKEIPVGGIESILIRENKKSIWYLLSRLQRIIQVTFKINFNKSIEKVLGFSFAHTSDTNSIAKAIRDEKSFNPDLIITLSKGGSFRPHRALLKLPGLHSKWMAYLHDPYPFHYYPRPYNWVETAYNRKQEFMRQIMEKANQIGYPSQLLMQWMESYFEQGKQKGIVIPHQIGDDPLAENLPDYFDENDFNLLHAGNLLKQRDPKPLIEAFLAFLENNPGAKSTAKLSLIGSNSYHAAMLSKYSQHPNIVIKGHTDYATVKLLEQKTSVNIVLEAVSEISPFLPGKFPNLVVANQPILLLCPYYSETKRLLGNEYPYWSEADDVEKTAAHIEKLYRLWLTGKDRLELGRPDLIAYCSAVYLKEILSGN